MTGTSLRTYGGSLNWVSGAIPTVATYAGSVDFTNAKVPFTPGATSWTSVGTIYADSPVVDVSNRDNLYLSEAPPAMIAPR